MYLLDPFWYSIWLDCGGTNFNNDTTWYSSVTIQHYVPLSNSDMLLEGGGNPKTGFEVRRGHIL